MNLLEQAIAALSPATAYKRAQYRNALDMVERRYEGAKIGRRTDGIMAGSGSANAEIGPDIVRLRNRARALVRDNPLAARAVEVWTGNTVGSGIVPRGKKRSIDLFNRWSEVCDADGMADFYGLETLAARSTYESGEVLVRFRPRRVSDGLPVPLQIQVLEADHLDTAKTEELRNGGIIIQGVEFDAVGRRIAYWLFPTHPGDVIGFSRRASFKSQRVSADQILHIFKRLRPGQVRGVTAFAPIIMRMHDLDDYGDAERMRKKIEACFVAFVTQQTPDSFGSPLGNSEKETATSRVIEKLGPGMIKYLAPDQEVKFGQPSSGGAGSVSWVKDEKGDIAAGLNLTYNQLTGDLSQANFASLRAGGLEQRQIVKPYRKDVLVHQFCKPIWAAVARTAEVAGVARAFGPAEWVGQRFEPIDQLKEVTSLILEVRAGLKTLDQAVAEYGGNPAEFITEIERLNAALDKAGVVLDTDPRKVSRSGLFQSTNAAVEDDPPPVPPKED